MKMEKTKGAQIRAGVKWIEEVKTTNKVFLKPEKNWAENNTINRLVKRDGEIVTDDSKVSIEIKNS